ncbi:hypothetical protein AAKU64_003297 [Undibacterium sp. GrIS 1.8]|uniref:TfpX/TfpZ family type IV pilin accessory protein n=1 Tax=Undibacterium sp. GrIS 1.8 TaxID=3143934 RepID=UPI003392CE47
MSRVKVNNRLQAFVAHLLISLCFGLLSATLVFFVWYPGLLSYATGVTQIFVLLLSVDVVLGPIITLVVFDLKKTELKRDLCIVALIQISALLYGIHTTYIARPVYIAFNINRFDLTYANEVKPENLRKASNPDYQHLPMFGPKIISVPLPVDAKLRQDIIFGAMTGSGEDVQYLPEYYAPYEQQKSDIIKLIKPLDKLKNYNKGSEAEFNALIEKYKSIKIDVGYLPLKGRVHDLSVILNKSTAEILEINKLKPFP